MFTTADVLPPGFDAVTVYGLCANTAVDDPEIVPFSPFRLSPDGSDGNTLNVTAVPVNVGISGVICCPAPARIVVCGYTSAVGAGGFTTICTEVVTLPVAFVAVTAYADPGNPISVGVPEIVPVEAFKLKPAGRAGLTLYELAAPVTVGISGVIATPCVAVITACGYTRFDGAARVTVTVTLADFVASWVDVAVIVAVPAADGRGVNTPALLTVPIPAGLIVHVNELLILPVPDAEAVHAAVCVELMAPPQLTVTAVIVF
jgi:hypothetical protein